ncbi:MAG: biotin carboxylase N-terminal domain-containing protein [Acidimicrobiales bacterium]
MSPVPGFDALLVANRGEIARRILRSARGMGLRTVAVFTEPDATAIFVSEADEAVRIPSHLDAEAIVAAARATGAAAVHPGYGFLAENAAFAAAVVDAGLVWVGPTASTIAAMGDKLEAKQRARAAGVPVLASTDDPARFGELGFPILVKAAAGGGGKGMRVVDAVADLDDAVASARREAGAAFADDRVFAERYVPRSRHIEIQILGDEHGNRVHLGERECSIQRRHQKVIEEAPSPFVTPELRSAMGRAALDLAAALDYRSAGTVEFLVDDRSAEFFFLEVNTRLQVEHPVTEAVTGIDLVREQLRIAQGEALGYGQDDIRPTGHAIEARLYAEDPANDFLPATGTVEVFAPAAEPPLRCDSGVAAGSRITVDFDPMLAKIIAHAPTRPEAAARLALGLERLRLGGVATNRDFLVATLRHPEFLAGATTTDFIERAKPARERAIPSEDLERFLVAATLWSQGANRAETPVLGGASRVPSGPPGPTTGGALVRGEAHSVVYRVERDGTFAIGDDAPGEPAVLHRWSADAVDVEYRGRRMGFHVDRSRRACI